MEVFGSRAGPDMTAAIRENRFELDEAIATLQGMSGSLDDAAARSLTTGEKFTIFKQKVMNALIPVGDIMLGIAEKIMPILEETVIPIFNTVATAVSSFFEGLERGEGFMDSFENALFGIADGLELPYEGFQNILEVVSEWHSKIVDEVIPAVLDFKDRLVEFLTPIIEAITQFVSWKDILILLGGVLVVTIIGAIASVIAAIAPFLLIVAGIIAVIALVRNAWENNWGGIQEKVAVVLAFVQNLITTVVTAIKEFWAENGDEILAKAKEIWEAIKEAISTAIRIASEVITEVVQAIKEFWAENGDEILAKAKEIWDAIKLAIETTINTISEIITTVVTTIQEFWAAHGDTILAAAEEVWDAIKGAIDTVFGLIQGIYEAFALAFSGDWRGFGEKLREVWDETWLAVKTAIEEFGPKLLEAIKTIVTGILGKIQEVDWGAVGTGIIQGIANGITAAAGKIADAAKNAAKAALEAAKGFLGIGSPSKVFLEVGANLSSSFAAGILDATKEVDKAIGNLLEPGLNFAGDQFGQAVPVSLPAGAGVGGTTSQSTTNNFNMTVVTGADAATVAQDFDLMRAIVGTE
jgi:phage-related protein